jgi:hypothetical protein
MPPAMFTVAIRLDLLDFGRSRRDLRERGLHVPRQHQPGREQGRYDSE